jgi:hypothetical protein
VTATVTVINNLTADIGAGVSKENTRDISASNGSFSVNYRFLQVRTH